MNLRSLFGLAAALCASAPLPVCAAPVVDWAYSISATREPQALPMVNYDVVVMDDGRVARFGTIPGLASLATASTLPGESTARLHGFGDGVSSGQTDHISALVSNAGAALYINQDDYLGNASDHLGYWEPANGYRWVQLLDPYSGPRYIVLTDTAIVTTQGGDSSLDAYALADGGLLWGRDFAEFGPFGSGRPFVVGGGLFLWVRAIGPDYEQPSPVSRLLSLDPVNGSTRWERELPRSPGFFYDWIGAVNRAPDGLIVTNQESIPLGAERLRMSIIDNQGVVLRERIIESRSRIESVVVSPDRASPDDGLAIAFGTTASFELVYVDRSSGNPNWSQANAGGLPQQLWTTSYGVLTHDRTPFPDTHGIVRLRSNADGALLWTHFEPLADGENMRPGTLVGETLVLPVEGNAEHVRTVTIDLATGNATREDVPEVRRRVEPTTVWVRAGTRLLNGGISGTPDQGSSLTAVALNADSGSELWRREMAIAAAPWTPAAPTSLTPGNTADHVLAWASLRSSPNAPLTTPERLVAVSLKTANGASAFSIDRSVARLSAALLPTAAGGFVAGYGACSPESCAGGFVLERIDQHGQSQWVRDAAASTVFPRLVPVAADDTSVYLSATPNTGQSFGIGASSMADGAPQWFEIVPASMSLPGLQAVPGWPLQFRGTDRVSQQSYFGRRDGQTGAVIWRSDRPAAPATVAAQLQRSDGNWLTSIAGYGVMRWMNFTREGVLTWSSERPSGISRASVRKIWEIDKDLLLAEIGMSYNGYFRRALLSLDAQSGAVLGERLIDVVDEDSALGRSRPSQLVAPRANGGFTLVTPGPTPDGVPQYMLQGWAAPQASSRRVLSLSIDPTSLNNGILTALGRVTRVILKVEGDANLAPAQAQLTVRSDYPVVARLADCRLTGGSCASFRTRQQLPLALTLGAGEIELEVEILDGVNETPSAYVDFHLDPDVDVLDSTLNDNDASVSARFGPFMSGFE